MLLSSSSTGCKNVASLKQFGLCRNNSLRANLILNRFPSLIASWKDSRSTPESKRNKRPSLTYPRVHFSTRPNHIQTAMVEYSKLTNSTTFPLEKEIIKSSEDKKHYRIIKLKNGLTAMLISDPSIPLKAENEENDGEESEEDESGEDDEDEEGSENGSWETASGEEDKGKLKSRLSKVGQKMRKSKEMESESELEDEEELESGEDEDFSDEEDEDEEDSEDFDSDEEEEEEGGKGRANASLPPTKKVGQLS